MPITYTNVAKPITPTYTNNNTQGKEQYDQASLEYDDADTFYDGTNEAFYTSVSKPITPSYTNVAKPT